MEFASRFENIPEEIRKDFYKELSFFNFAVTRRNWTGDTYINKKEIEPFISELIEHDDIISKQLDTSDLVKFYFLIDASIFHGKEVEGNIKLLDFLEELDDFHEQELETIELQKRRNKYLSKVRYYAAKPENLGYLYRWSFVNPHHSFSSEVKQLVELEIEEIKKAFHRKFNLEKLSKEQVDKFGTEGDALATLYSKKEEEIISKITKYSYSEPSLFLFNAYFVAKWIEHYKPSCMMFNSYFTITQYLAKNKAITDIYQGQTIHNGCYSYQEMMGDFLGLVTEDSHWAIGNLHLLDNLDDLDVNVHEEVLKSVAKWAAKKIYKNKKHTLPKKKWYTDVTWDFLSECGIKQITFIREKEIAGPNGKQFIVFAKAVIGEGKYLVYPIIDPANWTNLNLFQKALMTYTLCLYHDITVENAFSFEENEETSTPNIFKNPFVSSPSKKLVFEGVKATSRVNRVLTHKNNSSSSAKQRHHKEHWVTFHFRKIKDSSEASESVQEKAAKYDIEIPKGFTFIDAHVRGGNGEGDINTVKVSALDMFSRTVARERN